MKHLKYSDFEKAIKTLGLINKIDRSSIRDKYLKLSKKYHPDATGGDKEKFQEVNDAYHLLMEYIENFRFELSKDEFKNQYPFSDRTEGDWLYGV